MFAMCPQVAMYWSVDGSLSLAVVPSVAGAMDYSKIQPQLTIASPGLCRALFEM